MNVNLLAVLVAAVAAWMFGAAWYGALGRVWKGALFNRRETDPHVGKPSVPIGPMVVSFVAEFVMAFLLGGLIVHLGGQTIRAGLLTGFFCWLGFVATTLVTNHAYQNERPLLTAIDGGHWLGVLLLQGAVIGAMG